MIVQEAATVMEHKLCRNVQSAHVVLHDQGVLANAILGALVRASDESQLAEQVTVSLHNPHLPLVQGPCSITGLVAGLHCAPVGSSY